MRREKFFIDCLISIIRFMAMVKHSKWEFIICFCSYLFYYHIAILAGLALN